MRSGSEIPCYPPLGRGRREDAVKLVERVLNRECWPGSRPASSRWVVSGNFTGAFESWRVLDTLIPEDNETALRMCGTGALKRGPDAGEVESIKAAQALVSRTLVVLLAILTGLYVIAWIT